ncbi:unnamed protein product [Soboliphyme baturini]|uniref:Reverse transcriptase domain-containing protein n=1 Tax=Soboliphyme baturini TaxID=241478 RepID=A0A183J891_9BILA|nr:unnamed protein product [Soboliphyme baturini]
MGVDDSIIIGNARSVKQKAQHIQKESWWWNADVQATLRQKKELFKKWQLSNSAEDRVKYARSKRKAKKVVAEANSTACKSICEKLATKEGKKISTAQQKPENERETPAL